MRGFVEADMPVTKQYLRYAHSGTVGVICSRQCAPFLLERTVTKEKRLLAIAPALQDVVINLGPTNRREGA